MRLWLCTESRKKWFDVLCPAGFGGWNRRKEIELGTMIRLKHTGTKNLKLQILVVINTPRPCFFLQHSLFSISRTEDNGLYKSKSSQGYGRCFAVKRNCLEHVVQFVWLPVFHIMCETKNIFLDIFDLLWLHRRHGFANTETSSRISNVLLPKTSTQRAMRVPNLCGTSRDADQDLATDSCSIEKSIWGPSMWD